jgi:DNA topoisomerase-3
MGKLLVIAEKPSVALDIAKALGPFERLDGGEYFETESHVISFAVGHLVELNQPDSYDKKWKAWTLRSLPILPDEFARSPRDARATKRLKLLKKLAKRKDVDGYVNACDAGREGENIFRTVVQWIALDKPTRRLWLSSLTQGAIRKGFDSLRDGTEYDDLGDAAACRAEADWLIGMNATRAISIRLKSFNYEGVWTSGRVQTPTLTMLVDRELEIYSHRATPFWLINASFSAGGQTYEARFHKSGIKKESDRILSQEEADSTLAQVHSATNWTARDERSQQIRKAPLLFDLTSLQKAGNSLFGFSAKRTLDAAQRLYEGHKLISYPRTDSKFLPNDMRESFDAIIKALTGYAPAAAGARAIQSDGAQNVGRNYNDAKVTDHFAIVPLSVPQSPLSGDDEKIFNLIARQFEAAFMPPATWALVKRYTDAAGLSFVCSGRVLETPGFETAFGKVAGDGSPLAALQQASDNPADLVTAELEEKQTRPPARLSEARLLTKMETCGKEIDDDELSEAMTTRGLGTPATRAETIEKLISRQYLARDGKALRATAKAIRMIQVLRAVGASTLTSVELTGEMEFRLKAVEGGSLTRSDYMLQVRAQTEDLTERLRDMAFDTLYPESKDLGTVPGKEDMIVSETPWGYESTGDEPFFLWKDLRGYVLQPDRVRDLLVREDHTVGPITLYPRPGMKGDSYNIFLRLARWNDEAYAQLPQKGKREPSRWHLEILDESGKVEPSSAMLNKPDPDEKVVGELCTAKDGQAIQETNLRYCDALALKGERGGLTLPKDVCKRAMSNAEAKVYFETGSTEFLENFISKRGRPFKAKIFLKANGRHGFEFEPRKPRVAKAATDKEPVKKAVKKAVKKTVKKAVKKTVKKRKVAAKEA